MNRRKGYSSQRKRKRNLNRIRHGNHSPHRGHSRGVSGYRDRDHRSKHKQNLQRRV